MESSDSQKLISVMNENTKSIKDNDLQGLVPLTEGVKPISCKWIFKNKRDPKGNMERYNEYCAYM